MIYKVDSESKSVHFNDIPPIVYIITYKKSEKENTKNGIVYETEMLEAAEGFVDTTAVNE